MKANGCLQVISYLLAFHFKTENDAKLLTLDKSGDII
jgi:hypothetical protein